MSEKSDHYHESFHKRPFTVTAAFLDDVGEVIFHQMVVDRVERRLTPQLTYQMFYVIQNSFVNNGESILLIPVRRPYYVNIVLLNHCVLNPPPFQTTVPTYYDGVRLMRVVNEEYGNMEANQWYLLPQAYSIRLTTESKKEEIDKNSRLLLLNPLNPFYQSVNTNSLYF